MALHQIGGVTLAAERFRYLDALAAEFALRRRPRQGLDVVRVDLMHGWEFRYRRRIGPVMDATLYPYVLDPKLAPAIWGGNELVTEFGKHGDPNAKLGESWECWDTNPVTDGTFAQKTVADLRASLGPQFMGDLNATRI